MNYDSILDNISNIIKIDENKKEKLIQYASLVIDYNKNVNITGAKTEEDFFNDHIADCLLALDIFYDYDNIIDIGSGSGLPSIPLAIIFSDKKFTLCESKNKKAEFLRLTKDKLRLYNIEVKCINAYEIKEKYDTITSRAFSDISTLLKIFNKLKTKKSKLILYKGKIEKIEEELKEANIQKNKYNIEIKKLESKDKERHIVIIS
ncbi:16S rRNA (guanine(527)-N(7))-methyltransferase RsmG [Brachyspira hyodysenteriae]|uniref:16S rRNA (guanine(527)-N(7))-methyltransferase RsmG n=1 Tax=Brachyspira hyodysenteriae TaxID=159 RepID=UPI0022CD675D|nr:16S rRNA (guanine(527)-N(7))-methyltransferase RsmG [Brachyspira hyodysenteriae]MCZ9839766.1 16S rRNA (guanine(527)-N(7))-methyltransferase RsmG [Brachyspira hyodysenteriae]MCZ9847409.1 16S rRNA (guanine(527)-N(7))-methyltransferase RsmG [Brachyspira hyodysenteriae]MCZ9851006.1 16S rRNA (guanine(527)-N(7))-methyltransferase RsmG [Brachyspira hyodysenteriae]MCZ9860242.1 16S rRNA (guanine(527)-N(7))-methyltransferase RsmG [Brachyspira hyodysenteriae]MCZ9869476.1 16S rRNA (guanine(527)-N(7))-m